MTLSESMDTLRRELAALREAIEKGGSGQRDLYSAEEVAQRLSISLSTVRVLIARGELRYLRIGNLVRVPRSSIDRFCRRNHYQVWGAKDPETGRTRRPACMPPAAAVGQMPRARQEGEPWRTAARHSSAKIESGSEIGDEHERATRFLKNAPSYHGRIRSETKNSHGQPERQATESAIPGK